MHCEGCARKVRRCLKDFDGVEDVVTDCKTHKVVVKGEKADPVKVLERVQKKSHRQVELLSPIPVPAPAPEEEPKKPPEEVAKPEEKKEEVITVVLKAHMHCEACAEAIKKRILRMKGVENVEPDFKGSQVTVRGVFDPQNLVDYVAKKTGKRAVVVKVEPKKDEAAGEKAEEGKEEKKAEEGKKGGDGDGGEKKEGESGGWEKKEGDGEGVELAEDPKMEMKKHELYYSYYPPIQVNNPHYHHHQRFAAQDGGGYGYGYPQMFSDENPNACSVM
nr:heavy metal-associated isoprenylated plant protein 7-like [Ipomoea batatas]